MVATFIKKHLESLPKFNLLKSAYSGFLGTQGYDERTIYLDTENKELIWIKKDKELREDLDFFNLRKCIFNKETILIQKDPSTKNLMITFRCTPPGETVNNISHVERDLDISYKKGNEEEFSRFLLKLEEKNIITLPKKEQISQAGGKMQNKNKSKKYSKKLNKRSTKYKNNKSLKKRSNKFKKYSKSFTKRSAKSKK